MARGRGPGFFGEIAAWALAEVAIEGVRRFQAEAQAAKMAAFERDPLRRLGLEIITSTIGFSAALEVERKIGALARQNPHWWLASGVDPLARVGDVDHVLATGETLVCVETKNVGIEEAAAAQAARAAEALRRLDDRRRQTVPIVCIVASDRVPRLVYTEDGVAVRVTGLDMLQTVIHEAVEGCSGFDPDASPRLARQIYHAQLEEELRSQGFRELARSLSGHGWVCARNVRLHTLSRPISLLTLGPSGIFVIEPRGIDPHQATLAANEGARQLASALVQCSVEVIPVVAGTESDTLAHLRADNGKLAWAVPVNHLAGAAYRAGRPGLAEPELRRIRDPAPQWSYRTWFDEEQEQINWYWSRGERGPTAAG
ncbi:MAG: hypothetical protein DLM61_17495 [Pseudonocardiales bacterium]|nr:MAG: hypothetical protein DLM61_17495 [Pseudonocardiales bacterium]